MKGYGYKVKSNKNPEPLGTNKTLDERLIAIGLWFCNGNVDAKNYLSCLEESFIHWGWQPPKRTRTFKSPPKSRPEVFFEED